MVCVLMQMTWYGNGMFSHPPCQLEDYQSAIVDILHVLCMYGYSI